jgi:hypothetical protein
MRTIFAVIAAISAVALPGLGHAAADLSKMTPGYTYYNMPGTTLADHDVEVGACAAEAVKVQSFGAQANKHMSGLLVDAMGDAANRGAFAASLENCMVVRGWRVVRVPDAEGKKLSQLAPTDLAKAISPWIGAEQPHGEIVRIWGNDAANAEVTRYAIRPKHNNDGLLSLKAATDSPLAKVTIPPMGAVTVAKIDPKWPTKPLMPKDIATTLPEAGVVIVHLKGITVKDGIGFAFVRVGPDKDTFPSTLDNAPDQLGFYVAKLFAKKEGNFLAIAAPPGRWRLASMGIAPQLGFCLGAPSFSVSAGEVVYAGSFDMSGTKLGPDLSLDAPKAWLAGQPAAETIHAAEYTNGTQGLCGYNGVYALEVEGAPYEPGYKWGGAAKARSVEAAPE